MQLCAGPRGDIGITTMKSVTFSSVMKATAFLLAASLLAPAALLLGLSAAAAATTAISIGLTAIALNDYAPADCSYRTPLGARRTERHPLAA